MTSTFLISESYFEESEFVNANSMLNALDAHTQHSVQMHAAQCANNDDDSISGIVNYLFIVVLP